MSEFDKNNYRIQELGIVRIVMEKLSEQITIFFMVGN